MEMRILIIDDQPENVETLRAELEKELGCDCKIVGFAEAEATIEDHNPQIVVLDVMQGLGAEVKMTGLSTSNFIWEKKFCPLVFYTAAPEQVGEEYHKNNPFICIISKGAGSDQQVLARIREFAPQINALEKVSQEIRWTMNGALRAIAPGLFQKIEAAKRQEALVRSARRRVAAMMDDTISTGDPSLMPWELYLCPPVVDHLLTGDIIRKRVGKKDDPGNYAMILSPTCDLVKTTTREPRVREVLVSLCSGPERLRHDLNLQDIKPDKWKEDNTKKLLPALTQGYSQSCLPLAELPGEFPTMVADFRRLLLIDLTQIGNSGQPYVRVASVDNPFRELVAWAYMSSAARVALPDRDFDAWAKEYVPTVTG
jgi:CheY-like chemotaxis protein